MLEDQRRGRDPARTGPVTPRPSGSPGWTARRRVAIRRRRLLIGALGLGTVAFLGFLFVLTRGNEGVPPRPQDVRGSEAWALVHYGNPDARRFEDRNIVAIEFLGRMMFVHRGAQRHFLRLERLFEARAPEYAVGIAQGELDDWSYLNRSVRGGDDKSSHAFGIAVDVNALANVLGTTGDMPAEGRRSMGSGGWSVGWELDAPRPDALRDSPHAGGD